MTPQELAAIRERAEKANERRTMLHYIASCKDIPALLSHIDALEAVVSEWVRHDRNCKANGCYVEQMGGARNWVVEDRFCDCGLAARLAELGLDDGIDPGQYFPGGITSL